MVKVDWNQEVVDKTFHYYFYEQGFDWYRTWGFVAENLIRLNYGREPVYADADDGGYDFMDGERKIDVKSKVVPMNYHHSYEGTYYCVKNYKPLVADFYLFTKIDPENKVCSIVSWATHEEVVWFGEQVKKGETHFTRPRPVDNDAIFIAQKYTHLL